MPPESSFIPRSLLFDADQFGKDTDAEWHLATDVDGAVILYRAREQHSYACLILAALAPGKYSIPDLADQLGQDRRWLWRKLKGWVPATENDLIRWSWLTGAPRRSFKLTDLTSSADRPVSGPSYPTTRRRDP